MARWVEGRDVTEIQGSLSGAGKRFAVRTWLPSRGG